MATAEELLAQMEESPELYADSVGPVNDVIVINAEERTIELPESEKKFGTESDKKSERKHFKCPRIVGDNIDLSTLNLSINFKNANNEADIYPIEDVEVDGDYITFSWLLSKKVTAYKTDASKNQLLSFIFCAKSGENPDIEWNTTLCSDGVVLEGLEPGESIAEDNPDIIQYILERLESAGTITPEQISEAVEEYMASNPIEEADPTVPAWAKEEAPDKSLTQEGQAADAKEVGDRLGQLSDEKIDNPSAGSVGQILEIESVDEEGKPKTYKAVDKPTSNGEVSDEQIYSVVSEYMANNPIEENDPTVPEWAKNPRKPVYTASEVGAEASGTAESKVSDHNISDASHNDIRILIDELASRLNALADSDDTTLDQMSEVVAYIKSNKSLIDAISTSKVNVSDIIDNLTTNVSNKPLSAAQGVKLEALIDAIVVPKKLSELENDSGYAKTADIPDNLPNPKKLTFAGAVTAVYDGSEEVTVDIPEGGGSGESGFANYTVLKNETIKTDDSGITGIIYYDLDLSNYQDIVIFFDRQMNSNNTSGNTKITVKNIGYGLFANLDIGGTSDSYRSVLMRILNMGNDNVAVFSSVANNQQNNPANLMCNGIYPMNSVAGDGYRNKFEISFSKTYIGTINIMIFAK